MSQVILNMEGLPCFIIFQLIKLIIGVSYSGQYKGYTNYPQDIPSTVYSINLADNMIESVPEGSFDDFDSLQYFYMNNNLLTTFPNFGPQKHNILILQLPTNKISYISREDLLGFDSLSTFNLYNNMLRSMPDISSLISLDVLRIDHNEIPVLRKEYFPQTSNIRQFFVGGNPLTEFSFDVLQPLAGSLEILHLGPLLSMEKHTISREMLKPFTALNELKVVYCNLESVPDFHYQKDSFQRVELGWNSIAKIDRPELEFLLSPPVNGLRKIAMNTNKLQTFPCWGDIKSTVSKLDLLGNRFMCDCRMRDLLKDVQDSSNSLPSIELTPCSAPSQMVPRDRDGIDIGDLLCNGEPDKVYMYSSIKENAKKIGPYLDVSNTDTIFGCLRKCHRNPECWNFNYDENTKLCELMNHSKCSTLASQGTTLYEMY